jgi:integrase
MTRWRTSPTGSLRFNRDFSRLGVGRVTCSSHTTIPQEFKRRDAILTKLAENAQLETLLALKAGRISIEQLVEADRHNKLRDGDLLASVTLQVPLWDSVDKALPKLACGQQTRRRYQVSFRALKARASAHLPAGSAIGDLAAVPWRELQAAWGRSAADWNHLRRAVSAFLSYALRDKYHPFRRRVMAAFPKAHEHERIPDLTPDTFWKIVKAAPDYARPCFVTLVATGMRVGEYLRCTRFNLRAASYAVEVPGSKTPASSAPVRVDPALWPWVVAGIPCPLGRAQPTARGVEYDPRYKRLRRIWGKACEKERVKVRLHDLRHCMGQWSVDAGVPEAKVQVALRHKTPGMTRRYTLSPDRNEVAVAVASALGVREAS